MFYLKENLTFRILVSDNEDLEPEHAGFCQTTLALPNDQANRQVPRKRQLLWNKGSKEKAERATGRASREKGIWGGGCGTERAWG